MTNQQINELGKFEKQGFMSFFCSVRYVTFINVHEDEQHLIICVSASPLHCEKTLSFQHSIL